MEKAEVGICQSLRNPDILLMDEPFGALMRRPGIRWKRSAQDLKEKRTVIFVTNNIEEAVYLVTGSLIVSVRRQ